MTYEATYLSAGFSGGVPQVFQRYHRFESDSLGKAARIAQAGFVNDKGEFVMPAAILMVREVKRMIAPVDESKPVPANAKCQEASTLSCETYIACGAPATRTIRHDKDRRSYWMCEACADHNVRSRGGRDITVKGTSTEAEASDAS